MHNENASRSVVGFIGLGVMGLPMAENLLTAGYPLVVHNRSSAAVKALVAQGAKNASHPAAVAEQSEVVITMLPDTSDVEAVYFGDHGIFEGARTGQLLIDMSTISPAMSRKIAERSEAMEIASLDAPVSGGDVGARASTLSIMVGGGRAAYDRALPIFQVLGQQMEWMGEAGAGQVTKACNQIIVALTIEAVGEAFTLARRSGVDLSTVRKVLLGGFAQSRILDLHGQRLIDERFDPGFRVRLHRKDLGIALAAGDAKTVYLPVTALVHAMFNALVAQGQGERDHSYLAAYLAEQSP